MVKAVRMALERMWTDRCTVFRRFACTNPETGLTDFEEMAIYDDLPCRLSYDIIYPTDSNHTSTVGKADKGHAAPLPQVARLFLAPEADIPAGCRIVLRQSFPEREFIFASSGVAAVYEHHQELKVTPMGKYA